ncbi:hypothetical protein [Variovorax saccharolyticus]|uniref:hypothetical protein n=1 Tax=Variovorax saccharolyticus TaxID=3053516 RepID=UPI002577B7C4|nr:hypothetical protein [Variovorax sp. J22R187]MDM0018387.1 hypothetical protein [Variovorax sp. J22R187]
MEVDELLHHAERTDGANDNPLIRALCEQLEEYRQREADGELDQSAWRTREKALKDDLAVAREERDRMCLWAFGAAIDRLNEGLEVLASPTGPKNAREFDHNWCWLDFATQEMTALRTKFLENFGRLESEAKHAIATTMPNQASLFEREEGGEHRRQAFAAFEEAQASEWQQSEPEQSSSPKDRRLSKSMRIALRLLLHAQDNGRPMRADELRLALESTVHRTTAKTTPGKLIDDGYVTKDPDGTLRVKRTWQHLAK